MSPILLGLMLGIAMAPSYPPAWLRVGALLGALLMLGACTADVPASVQAPAVDQWADYGSPADPQLWVAVVERWEDAGFPSADGCDLPREVIADRIMFEEICGRGAGGASACQRPGLIVIADGMSTDPTRTRAHEYLHWLVECTRTGTAAQNRAHAVPGVWFEEGAILESFGDT